MRAVFIAGVVVALALCGCGGDDNAVAITKASPKSGPTVDVIAQMATARATGSAPAVVAVAFTPTPVVTLPPSPTPIPPTATPRPPTATPTPKGIGDGVWVVGRDIQPGTYQSAGGVDGREDCYWARLRNFTGNNDVIANQLAKGQQIVTIVQGDAGFESRHCAAWVRIG